MQAQTSKSSPVGKATVNYFQTNEDAALFRVQVDNEAGEKFSITIRDGSGHSLYQDTYQEKKFDKRFLIKNSDENAKLTFVVRFVKDNQTQAFETSMTTRIVEDVVVTKVN